MTAGGASEREIDVEDLDYELPEALIAQHPLAERDGARLLALSRATGDVRHAIVRELPRLIPPSLVVVNDTRVIPARLLGVKRRTGGRVELLLLERVRSAGAGAGAVVHGDAVAGDVERWRAIGRASKGLAEGVEVVVGAADGEARVELVATVVAREGEGELVVELRAAGGVAAALERVGRVPLPPYIRRDPVGADRERYQTVFAERDGAVAAPTAGLHLSRRLLDELAAAGHELARVTLHVGPGTFAPIRVARLSEHAMHGERWEVSDEAARAVARAKREGRPVLAVGTTVVRTLESAADDDRVVRAGAGETRLFIRPPYRFRVVDALLTNFHLPRSTLLALVMAFGGAERVRRAYEEAVRAEYRFFSYGDAMLIA